MRRWPDTRSRMSLKAMSTVWAAGLPDRSMKLCALALADWCDDDGNSLHPSVDKVADRMSATRRTAQRTLHQMIDIGLLEVTGNSTGGAPGSSRRYRLRLDRLANLAHREDHYLPDDDELDDMSDRTGDRRDTRRGDKRDTPETGDTGDTGDTGGKRRVTPVTETGDRRVTQSVSDPSIEPSVGGTRTARAHPRPPDVDADVWSTWLQVRRAKRAGPVTNVVMAGIEREAAKAGLTVPQALTVCCERSWQGFDASWLRQNVPRQQSPPRLSPNQQLQQTVMSGLTGSRIRTIDVEATEAPAPVRLR